MPQPSSNSIQTNGTDALIAAVGALVEQALTHTGNLPPRIFLSLLEKEDCFIVNNYEYHIDTKKRAFLSSEELEDSQLRFLSLFCGFPTPNDTFRITFRDEVCYARPLSLWLGPIGFLLIPSMEDETCEQGLANISEPLQQCLASYVWQKVNAELISQLIYNLEEERMHQLFLTAIAGVVIPWKWQSPNELQIYAGNLFSANDEEMELNILLSEDLKISFVMPPIRNYLANKAIAWAYQKERLEQQRQGLVIAIDQAYEQFRTLHNNLRDQVQQTSVPVVSKMVTDIQNQLGNITDELKVFSIQLNDVTNHIQYSSPKIMVISPIPNILYKVASKRYKVVFDGVEIFGLGQQFCRILYALFSHPELTFNMSVLYAYTKVLQTAADDFLIDKDHQDKVKLLSYISKKRIREKDLLQIETFDDRLAYEKRIQHGITLLQKTLEKYPELEVNPLLLEYKALQDKYFSASSSEAFDETTYNFKPPKSYKPVSKKTERERISKQLDTAYNVLKKNGYDDFLKFLKAAIRKEPEDNGIHYYTYRPSAAPVPHWRTIEWQLSSSDE